MGRPPEFAHRVRLQVFLERSEYAALRRAARLADLSVSAFARRTLVGSLVGRTED
jgi:hypothetical protein